jgi:hypothetical protein
VTLPGLKPSILRMQVERSTWAQPNLLIGQ